MKGSKKFGEEWSSECTIKTKDETVDRGKSLIFFGHKWTLDGLHVFGCCQKCWSLPWGIFYFILRAMGIHCQFLT